MAEPHSLDGRSRDADGTIRQKNGNTQVATLRAIYGPGFAAGSHPDMKLSTLLERTGLDSLSKYVQAGKPHVPKGS